MYLSHYILERVDVSIVCERWVETGTDRYIDPTSTPDPSSTSSASWLGLLNRWSLRATALSLQAGPHSGLPVPTNSTATGTCLYSFLKSTCFCFFFRLVYNKIVRITDAIRFYVLISSQDAFWEFFCDSSLIERREKQWRHYLITSSDFLKDLFDQQLNFKNDFPGWIISMPR